MSIIVHSSTHSSGNITYPTLNYFVKNSTNYFTSNTKFLLNNGSHKLDIMLPLKELTNVTFVGSGSSEIIIGIDGGIMLLNSSNIFVLSVKVSFQRSSDFDYIHLKEFSASVLLIYDSFDLTVRDVIFQGPTRGNGRSRAIAIYNSSLTVLSCCFFEGNHIYGGAIYAMFSTLRFYKTNLFVNNNATSGGAIYSNNRVLIFNNHNMKSDVYIKSTNEYNITSFESYCYSKWIENYSYCSYCKNCSATAILNCSSLQLSKVFFISNSAVCYGGALMIQSSTVTLFDMMEFKLNIALAGAAIYVKYSAVISEADINFYHNMAQVGGGVFIGVADFFFNARTLFCNNSASNEGSGKGGGNGGGIYLFWGMLAVTGFINFTSNSAINGGGLYIEQGKINLTSPLSLLFNNNQAKNSGGFIYFSRYTSIDPLLLRSYLCSEHLFHVTTNHSINSTYIKLLFMNSKAKKDDIFSADLDTATICINNASYTMTVYELLQKLSPSFSNISVSSDVRRICFCYENTYNCLTHIKEILAPPGKIFNISVIGVGVLNLAVPSEAAYKFDNDVARNVTLVRKYYYNSGPRNSCYDISLFFHSKHVHTNFSFQIYPYDSAWTTKNTVNVNVLNCPPGFELKNDSCNCDSKLLKILKDEKSCDINREQIKIPKNYWLKPLTTNSNYTDFMFSKRCAQRFCKSNSIWLNFSNMAHVDRQCNAHRTGILCGQCEQNYSLTLGNLKCDICNNRYISLILFFIAAGIIVVAISLVLQLNLSKGTLSGLMLYANIISISKDLFFPTFNMTSEVLTIFISWINLDFGIPVCFYNGLNAYSYAWLQFVFPVYLWILTILIIIISKYSKTMAQLMGSNPMAMLATIILLSYTKLLQVCQVILSYETITYANTTSINLWKLDPSVEFFKGKHIPIALFAICVLAFVLVPYTTLLLFGYRLLAFSGKRGFRWFNKFKPLLDAHYAPFTYKARYWIGLLLLVRVCILIYQSAVSEQLRDTVLIFESSLLIFVISIPWTGTYSTMQSEDSQFVLSYVSVGIALIEFIGILVHHLLHPIFRKRILHILHQTHLLFTNKKYEEREIELQKAEVLSTTLSINFREPLLESVHEV